MVIKSSRNIIEHAISSITYTLHYKTVLLSHFIEKIINLNNSFNLITLITRQIYIVLTMYNKMFIFFKSVSFSFGLEEGLISGSSNSVVHVILINRYVYMPIIILVSLKNIELKIVHT